MKSFFNTHEQTIVLISFGLIALLFTWTYALAPFTEFTNAIIVNSATTLAALIGALILTRITSYFQRLEPPFVIWSAFAICMWLWTIAEGYWGYLYTIVGEVPLISLSDMLWLIGYLALTVSMVRQFRLVFFDQKTAIGWAAVGAWLAVLTATETVVILTGSSAPLDDFIVYFYLFADTAVGLAALYLVIAFRGQALAIPWLTISSFVVTDFLYIHITRTGAYDYVMSGISIALLADTLYVVAYLIVAWGALRHYLLLKRSFEHH